jgi:WD40 repeat protein
MFKADNKLYLLLNSRELIIFDWKNQKVELKVQFTDHTITCIHVTNEYFLFSDTFSFIYAIKLTEFTKEDVKNPDMKKLRLLGHEGWILAMFHHEKFLYTCSDDKSIRVWDIQTCKLFFSCSGAQR